MTAPRNVAEAFSAYQTHMEEPEFVKTKTALLRFTVPGWSNRYPAGKRSSRQEMVTAIAFLETVPLYRLKTALEVQALVFEKMETPQSNQRVFKSYLKRFLDWCDQQGWFEETTLKSGDAISYNKLDRNPPQGQGEPSVHLHRFIRPKGTRRSDIRSLNLSGVAKKPNYALGTVEGDYLNRRLTDQLDELCQFMQTELGHCLSTRDRYRSAMLQLLGWLHRNQRVQLDELCLEKIIPLVNCTVRVTDFLSTDGKPDQAKFAAAKIIAEDAATQAARQTAELLQQYVNFLDGTALSKLKALEACVTTAKFLYSERTRDPKQYRDVPVILMIRKLMRPLRQASNSQPRRIPFEAKSLPWENVYWVLMQLKQDADTVMLHQVKPDCRNGVYQYPRKQSGIARSYRQFLALGFLTLMPPDRPRTIRELEVGRTLIWGEFQNGIFLPAARLQDASTAAWYIHLQPQDYKTGSTYGEYWAKVPNTDFGDGTCFYDYIERWLNQYRSLFNPDHDLFFTRLDGTPMNRNSLNQMFRTFFSRFTGVPVTPKELRPMYVTYLRDNQATEAELEAAARAMHHSREMQAEIYDRQQILNKQEPIHALNLKVIAHVFPDTHP